jgi:hypothetical protein
MVWVWLTVALQTGHALHRWAQDEHATAWPHGQKTADISASMQMRQRRASCNRLNCSLVDCKISKIRIEKKNEICYSSNTLQLESEHEVDSELSSLRWWRFGSVKAGSEDWSPVWYKILLALSYTSRHVRWMSNMYFLPVEQYLCMLLSRI